MAEQYTIILRPLPDTRPADIRLRKLLKHALRQQRLRCVDVAVVAAEGRQTPVVAPLPDATPHRAGSDTSEGAAVAIAPRLNGLRLAVRNFIRDQGDTGATVEDVAAHLCELRHQQPGNAGTRITAGARLSELAAAGLIRDSGRRRLTRSGCSAAVYVSTSNERQDIHG